MVHATDRRRSGARHRFLMLSALALCVVLPASAQKSLQDPRPWASRPNQAFPTFTPGASLAGLGAQEPLTQRAVPLAPGGVTTGRGVPAPLAAAAGKAGATPDFDVPQVQRAPNGTARWIGGALGQVAAAPGKQAGSVAADVVTLLDRYAPTLGLERPSRELAWIGTSLDDLGAAHVRFEQTYEGVPVWGRDLYVHLDAEGEIYAVNGTYEPTPSGARVEPSVQPEAAVAAVVADLQAEGRWAPPRGPLAHAPEPSAQLVLFPTEAGDVRLAYEVDVHANLVESYLYLIDAHTGDALTRIARHCSFYADGAAPPVLPAVHAPEAPVVSAASARAGTFRSGTGRGVNGDVRQLRVWESDEGRQYMIWDLPNVSSVTSPNDFNGGSLVGQMAVPDEDGSLFHVTSDDGTWADPAAIDAHAHAELTYRYYADTFGRQAIDDLNTTMVSVVHFNEAGAPVDNAFWNGRQMIYGDGDRIFKPLSAGLDVAGHEMTHGVIQHTANLIYQFEPGALNESFADVFAVMVDRDDFLLAEDIIRDGLPYVAMRDLANPGAPNLTSPQPAHMDDFRDMPIDQDNGGVHVNSGIPNRAAYLVAEAIGREKTEQIYYRALSVYLTRNSQFVDARNALVQSAEDLYGAGSAEGAAVGQAFDAVGIAGGPSNPPDDDPDDVDPVTGGTGLVAFMQLDGRIGVYDVEANEYRLFENARARVDTETGDLAQLTTPLSGEEIWYVDPEGRLAYVNVQTGEVFGYPDLSLYEPGDVWNASVSPDRRLVTLISAYRDDASLYIFDGQEVFRLPLRPDGTQEGTTVETIQYPDVVTWSPNARQPKLAVDALNALPIDGSTVEFWSIYEVDLASGEVFNLIPAQPTDLSIGNVTYSNTDPDVVAFNLRTESNGETDIVLADFDRGEAEPLGLVGQSLGSNPITAALRPTFAPADDLLAISLPEFNALGFYDLETRELVEAYQFPEALFNTRWFVFDGTAPEPDGVLPAPGGLAATPSAEGVSLSWAAPAAAGAASKAAPVVASEAPPKGTRRAWASPPPAAKAAARVDEVEPNNTLDTSQPLAGAAPLTVNGNAEVNDAGDLVLTFDDGTEDDFEDLFRVTTTAPGLSVQLADYTADLDLYLLRVAGNTVSIVDASNTTEATEQVALDTLSAGTYYVAVSIYDAAPGQNASAYTLTLTGSFGGGGGGTPPAGLRGYYVYRATQPNVPLTPPHRLGSAAAGAPAFLDDTVPEAGTYYYAVTAVYAEGESAASNVAEAAVTPPPCPIAWRSPLTVTNADGDGVSLAFGQGSTATAGVDEVCEETALLPPPPLLVFDARFQLTGGSTGTPTDLRSLSPGDVWRLRVQAGGASRVPVTLQWDPAALPDGDIRLRNADGLDLDMKAESSFTITQRNLLSTYAFQIVYGSGSVTSAEDGTLPTEPTLGDNYPNPFNPTTTFDYALPQTGPVRVEVFDAVGRRVAVLVDGVQAAGRHTVRFDARGLPSGTYFYRLRAGAVTRTQQMVLLK